METSIYFMGTYAGVYARDQATGGKAKDEDILYKSLMMMPLTAPYGIVSMVNDPMAPSIVGDSLTQLSKVQRELGSI
jgi:hypothetical protein